MASWSPVSLIEQLCLPLSVSMGLVDDTNTMILVPVRQIHQVLTYFAQCLRMVHRRSGRYLDPVVATGRAQQHEDEPALLVLVEVHEDVIDVLGDMAHERVEFLAHF